MFMLVPIMVVDTLISILGLPPIGEDVGSYYNFLLTAATFLFFLITAVSVFITAVSIYYSRESSIIVFDSLKIAQIEQINNEIEKLEEKTDRAEKKLNHILTNLDFFSELENNISEEQDENGQPVIQINIPYETICIKLKDMHKDSRNMYFHDLTTGKNPLDNASFLLNHPDHELLAKTISSAILISKEESRKTSVEMKEYQSKIQRLISKKEKMQP